MARIRSIKPDFWTSEQVIECSTNARLLFIGLWNFCDDAGRHTYSPRQIRAQVFPGDDFTTEDVARMLDELSSNDLISRYVVDGKEYFYVTGWRHQKIDKPQKPICPEPLAEHSSNGIDGEDRIGRDRIGEEDAAQPRENVSRETEAPRLVSTEEPDDLGDIPPILDRGRNPTEVARIEAELFAAAPGVKSRDTSPIFAYLDKRHDLETLILPVIRERAKPGIASWNYFCGAINAAILAAARVKPNGGTPARPTIWITADDPRWQSAAGRYHAEKGRWPAPRSSRYDGGIGYHFPAEYLPPTEAAA